MVETFISKLIFPNSMKEITHVVQCGNCKHWQIVYSLEFPIKCNDCKLTISTTRTKRFTSKEKAIGYTLFKNTAKVKEVIVPTVELPVMKKHLPFPVIPEETKLLNTVVSSDLSYSMHRAKITSKKYHNEARKIYNEKNKEKNKEYCKTYRKKRKALAVHKLNKLKLIMEDT
jgi:ribosomal protein S27E